LASTFSMNAGENQSTTFKLSNTYTNNIQNINITLSGIDSSWYSLSKKTVSSLLHGSTDAIILTFNIPTSAEAKEYNIDITAKGSEILTKLARTATATMKLTVNNSNPNVVTPSLETPIASTTSETQNVTTSEQIAAPTGLAATFEYLTNNLLIIIAMAACVLIFIFREDVNENLAKVTGKSYKTHYKGKAIDFSSIKKKMNYKLPDFGKFKMNKRKLEPEKPEVKRPEMLEREIKRDIKELEHIVDVERTMNKKKKFNVENN